jgi:pimeloyl-ACP methyl ester carboxylesterase
MSSHLTIFPRVLLGGLFLISSVFANSPRPQEPTTPYPYDEVEVSFTNPHDGVTLAGTLTLPRSKGPFPAVILLHGSAPFDRNCMVFGHKLFLVWADHLTKQGIAVLRYDKRSSGKSTGDYETATLEEFAQDALAGVEYLKSRSEINLQQMGLIGHSEGGMTATLAASKSQDVAFIVLMAAPAVNWEDLVILQQESLQRVDGIAEETIAKNSSFRKRLFSIVKNEKNQGIAEQKIRDCFAKYLKTLTPVEHQIAAACFGPIDGQIQMVNSAWFRYGISDDPCHVLKKVAVPILALNGDRDFVVVAEQNLTKIERILKEAHHRDYTVMVLPNINHGFQTCQTGSIKEYAQLEETTSPVVLKTMSDWILKKTSSLDAVRS